MRISIIVLMLFRNSFLFSQHNINQPSFMEQTRLTNFFSVENSIKPFLNDSSKFGHHQSFSVGFNIGRGSPSKIYTYNNTIYYKMNNRLIADANLSFSNFIGSHYEDKYGYKLLNDISGDFDAGIRFYPIKNSFFNIDLRNYNSSEGPGSSLDLDFMGITIKRFVKKGYIKDNQSIFD